MTIIESPDIVDFLETVYRHHGYDFRHYAKSSLRRRIDNFMNREGAASIKEMKEMAIEDDNFINRFLSSLSVGVTSMFRDPEFFREVRVNVIPYLKTFPFFKVWHAGCSTGEEAYSLAIMLMEEGIYERARIYATDIDGSHICKAKDGVFRESDIKSYHASYVESGGCRNIEDYFCTKYGFSKIHDELKSRILFSSHNLVSDGSFGVMQIIFCRNVIIYFDDTLKRRVINLFSDSLDNGGVLCLGSKESLEYLDFEGKFEHSISSERVYRKQVSFDPQ